MVAFEGGLVWRIFLSCAVMVIVVLVVVILLGYDVLF